MPARFYAPALTDDVERLRLGEDESHHLVHVLRLHVGDTVHIFNGAGLERAADVAGINRQGVSLTVREPVVAVRESRVALTLVQAVLKGDHMDAVVRDATMVGVTRIVPVVSARTLVSSAALRSGRLDARWARTAVSSTKQCGRAVVPTITAPCALGDALALGREAVALWLTEPTLASGDDLELAALRGRAEHAGAIVAVGPEGGWTPEELRDASAAGWQAWSLGPATLRADAAGAMAAAILRYVWDVAPSSRAGR